MATGYTYEVADGKVTTLREFALRCARGMGALIMMRDDPLDAPIPERFEPSSRSADRIAEARAEIARLHGMTADEATAASAAERAKVEASNATYAAEKAAQVERYEAMIAKVEAWQGAPEGLKEFMLDQLCESLRFDGGEPYQAPLPPVDGEAWRAAAVAKAERDITYHTEERAREVKRTEGRNAWIAQLRASLPEEAPALSHSQGEG